MSATLDRVAADAPARELAEWIRVAWYFLWTLGPAAVLWSRYRRMSP